MYQIMKHYGLPQKVINIIRNSYDGFKCRVKAEGEKGRLFDVRTGVRQGDVWSPILFGLVINYILANSVHGGLDIGRYGSHSVCREIQRMSDECEVQKRENHNYRSRTGHCGSIYETFV